MVLQVWAVGVGAVAVKIDILFFFFVFTGGFHVIHVNCPSIDVLLDRRRHHSCLSSKESQRRTLLG